jgi:hypothetical protein
MEDYPLLPELERFERLLSAGPQPEPSAALRRRVLRGVRSELRRDHNLSTWRFVASAAATLLVTVGLLLNVLQATGFARQQRVASPSVSEIARRLQELAPRLSREESLRQAALRHMGAEPGCRILLGDIFSEVEHHDP